MAHRQGSSYYSPTGNEANLSGGTALSQQALNSPLRQGAVPYDDDLKGYFGPNGVISEDYSGVGTQTAAYRFGSAVAVGIVPARMPNLGGGGEAQVSAVPLSYVAGASQQGGTCSALGAAAGLAVGGAAVAVGVVASRTGFGYAAGAVWAAAARALGFYNTETSGCTGPQYTGPVPGPAPSPNATTPMPAPTPGAAPPVGPAPVLLPAPGN